MCSLAGKSLGKSKQVYRNYAANNTRFRRAGYRSSVREHIIVRVINCLSRQTDTGVLFLRKRKVKHKKMFNTLLAFK